jgi:3-hydroxyisobutyrate dehydrogenase-like beta-hydroxyacid dehydrogenase
MFDTRRGKVATVTAGAERLRWATLEEEQTLALPGLALVNQLYNAVAAQGHARSGTQALIFALRALSAA